MSEIFQSLIIINNNLIIIILLILIHLTPFTAQAHSSVERAGLLGGVQFRLLESDSKHQLRGETLAEAIRADKEKGLIPFYVSAPLYFRRTLIVKYLSGDIKVKWYHRLLLRLGPLVLVRLIVLMKWDQFATARKSGYTLTLLMQVIFRCKC